MKFNDSEYERRMKSFAAIFSFDRLHIRMVSVNGKRYE